MITYKNFTKELITNFPEFSESVFYTKIFPDGGFDEPYFVCASFFDWYVNKNRTIFFYKKSINNLFTFCNKVYSGSDDSAIEIIKDAVYKNLIHKPRLRFIALKELDGNAKADLSNIMKGYRKELFKIKI
jgi:hypothetical protein